MSFLVKNNDAPSLRLRCKVMVLGDCGSGKTTMCSISSFGQNAFKKDYSASSSVSLSQCVVKVDDADAEVEFFLIDVPGIDLWAGPADGQIPSTNFFLFFSDVAIQDTPQQLQSWYKRVADLRDDDVIPGAVVLNKVDLIDEATAESITAPVRKFAEVKRLKFFETSAIRTDRAPFDAVLKDLANTFHQQYQEAISFAKRASE